jgi:hypothetical protein
LHGNVIPSGAITHEAPRPAVNLVEIAIGRAMDLATEAKPHIIVGFHDARFCFPEGGQNFLGVIPNA